MNSELSNLIKSSEITVKDYDDDFELPKYSTPGRIYFEVYHIYPETHSKQGTRYKKYEINIVDCETDTSVFWLEEGSYTDYWLEEVIDIDHRGFYVMEGVTGSVYTDYFGETDEDWDFKFIRYASEEEFNIYKDVLIGLPYD